MHDDDRPSETGARPGRRWQVRPPDFALGDHHSLRSMMREDAAARNGSVPTPASAQALSMASVTASGACRARYSLTASLYNWLRDFLVRFANRSAPSNTLFAIETAVFILVI